MSQPTLVYIPGILLRTFFRLIARVIFLAAELLFLGAVVLTLASLLLATWKTPRSRRWELAVDIVLLVTELAKERHRVTKTDSH